jgi:hypothetical protein
VGVRGSGKTGLARHMADRAPLRVLFDPTPNRKQFPRRPMQSYVVTADGATDAIADLGAVDATTGDPIDEILVAPSDDVDACFEATCDALRELLDDRSDDLDAPGVAFLVDELWTTNDRAMPWAFDYLVRSGDLEKLQIIVTVHQPTDVPPKMRALVRHWFLFQCVDENSLKLVRARFPEAIADALPTLPALTYVHFSEPRRTWAKFDDPRVWRPRD